MKKILTIIFCLAALTAAGQSKTRQVDEALGTRISEIPKQGDRIEYVFQVGTKDVMFHRTGDGASEYTELLQSTSGLGTYNDQGGTLLYIRKNGEVVARANAVGEVADAPRATRVRQIDEYQPSTTGDPVRPRTLNTTSAPAPPSGFIQMDSMQIAERLDGLKHEITGWKAQLWRSIAPIWDFFMFLFASIAVFLVCCILIFRYIANSAANEALVTIYGNVITGRWIITIQQNAAALTLVCVWAIAVVLFINAFLWMVTVDMPLPALIPIAWFLSWVAEKVTDWLVPNLKVVGGSRDNGMQPY